MGHGIGEKMGFGGIWVINWGDKWDLVGFGAEMGGFVSEKWGFGVILGKNGDFRTKNANLGQK